MNFLVSVFLAIGSISAITAKPGKLENWQILHGSSEITTATSRANEAPEDQISWLDLNTEQSPINMDKLGRAANANVNVSNRKSKILRSLAFISGLSVGDLAGAASSDVAAYAQYPPLGLNVGASRISPPIAALYNPYRYVSQPYVFATPLGFYPLWDPLRLQSINGVQNTYGSLAENSQTSNQVNNNNPDKSLNNDDEYVDEAKKIENVKAAGNAEENNKSAELQAENDRNAEEKVLSSSTTCNVENEVNSKKDSSLKSIAGDREIADGSLTTTGLRVASATGRAPSTDTMNKNTTQTPGTSTSNSTIANDTTTPPYGYYGGYPQNINHIDLTTDTYEQNYHDYGHINHNIPTYDKPINFYSDDRYNYYNVPSVDPYPTSQFHQNQIPEYLSNDFKRYVYTFDNNPSFVNSDFRPVV